MGLQLGNLTVKQMEDNLGICLSETDRDFFETARQDEAKIQHPDKLHIYNLPFLIGCGSKSLSDNVMKILRTYQPQMHGSIEIGYVE
jgi:dihydropteroate synthase